MKALLQCFNNMSVHSRIKDMNKFTQHGNTSCLLHTLAVAYYSVRLARFFGININKRELIRGAILHDYFLYDWHDGKKERRIHGFTHPFAALRNAEEDFNLTNREKDIISKHMFPLTIKPPSYIESWLVCLVDKYCSVYEAFKKKNTYIKIRTSFRI